VRIIGIDPGLESTGYAVLDDAGREQKPVEGGVIRTKPADALELRLLTIYRDVKSVLTEFNPQEMAIEDLHARYQHGRTAILMGHARGIVCMAAAEAGVPVTHYAPARVKNLVTGSGRADKEQVQRAVTARLGQTAASSNEHVADAFAIALCHVMMSSGAGAALNGARGGKLRLLAASA
jgi:crossover junction endodeoxyribonuclease RuvC